MQYTSIICTFFCSAPEGLALHLTLSSRAGWLLADSANVFCFVLIERTLSGRDYILCLEEIKYGFRSLAEQCESENEGLFLQFSWVQL